MSVLLTLYLAGMPLAAALMLWSLVGIDERRLARALHTSGDGCAGGVCRAVACVFSHQRL